MNERSITARRRKVTGRKTNQLRVNGHVPAVVYGFEIEPTNLTLSRNDLERLYTDAGESTVIALQVNGTDHPVLIQDIQQEMLKMY
ncbi:MAG: hypothetical protein IIA00_07275 [Proteobacteria bacterium]|nr:hypothetical protein [Pseudomonadota bacterium]